MKQALGRWASLVLLGSLAACASVQTSHEGATADVETRSTGFMNLVTKDDVEVHTPKAFAGVQKLVIGGFKVGFNESKTTKGSSRLVGGTTTGQLKLNGVDAATRQAIVDWAYDDFVGQLKSQGYQIVSRDLFLAHPAYTKLSEHEFPFRDDNSALFSDYGVGNYHIPSAMGTKQVFFYNELPQNQSGSLTAMFKSTPGQGFSAIGLSAAVQEIAADIGIPVINATYLVDFAAGSNAGFSIAQLKLGQLVSVDHGVIGLTGGAGGSFSTNNGRLSLGQPVASDKPYATMEDETTTATKVAEGAVNLVFKGGILGAAGIGGDHTRNYVFNTSPEQFTAAAHDALGQANAVMAGKMAQLR